MAIPSTEPTQLGKFFAYPQNVLDDPGYVLPYWLASSPGSGQLVRMTPTCKRAFLATLEAVIERALVPANCGSFPAVGTDFKAAAFDVTNGIRSLVSFSRWKTVADRAALGARLKRGCPREDWNAAVQYVAALWGSAPTGVPCGTVYAWQMKMLDFSTNGWIEEVDGHLDITGMNQVIDVVGYYADEESYLSGVPVLRPWGAYPGGNMTTPVTDWVSSALVALGANPDTGSGIANSFADDQLNGNPAPLAEGHEGNWFGSTSGAMVNSGAISARRSSSAWAVLQAMLANMLVTHLAFPYAASFNLTRERRVVARILTMDGDDIVAEEYYDDTSTTFEETTDELSSRAECTSSVAGTAYVECAFSCADEEVDSTNQLVRFDPPDSGDGWVNVGTAIYPFIGFGSVYDSSMTVQLDSYKTTSVASVTAGNGQAYPAAGFRQYVHEYGGVTFVDCESYFEDGESDDPDWTKYSVRHEGGNQDLTVPVRSHAQWLLGQLPSASLPIIPPNPGTLTAVTNAFWAAWDVRYTPYPNIQIDGSDAYFPIAFRNSAFVVDNSGWTIAHYENDHEWRGSSGGGGAPLGPPGLVFPGLDLSSYDHGIYKIQQYGSAMAAYHWRFKAMPA